jgi:hypothetical protein
MFHELTCWLLNIWYYCVFRWRQPSNTPPAYTISELIADPSDQELAREFLDKEEEELVFQCADGSNNSLFIEIHLTKEWITACLLFLVDGKKYTTPGSQLKAPRWKSNKWLLNVGPLRVELREPYRRWRVTYRGDLR